MPSTGPNGYFAGLTEEIRSRLDRFFELAKKQDSDGLAVMYTDDCILSGDDMRPIIGIEGGYSLNVVPHNSGSLY